MLLIDKNEGLGVNSFRVISLCNSLKGVLVSASYSSYLAKQFQEYFIFCINLDTLKVLLLAKNGPKVNSFRVISLCNSWKAVLVSASYFAKYF